MEMRPNPSKSELTPWPWPSKPWSRIHADFLGPFYDHMFLAVIDAHTKWPEVIIMKKDTTAKTTIKALDEIFGRFGIANHLVTDNGPQWTSSDFENYMKNCKIKHTFSSPYHPATNGAAENFVKTFKDKIEKMIKDGNSLNFAINRFLGDFRNTEHSTTGKSPAQLQFNRQLRTRHNVLKPEVQDRVESQQYKQKENMHGHRKMNLTVGNLVYARDYRRNTNVRSKAEIIKVVSPVTCYVKFEDGLTSKRHANQLVDFVTSDSLERGEIEKCKNPLIDKKKIEMLAKRGQQ